MEAESLFFLIIALGLAFGVGCLGSNRKMEKTEYAVTGARVNQ